MQKMGRVEASEDEEYATLKAGLKDMQTQYRNVNSHLQAFIGCIRSAWAVVWMLLMSLWSLS